MARPGHIPGRGVTAGRRRRWASQARARSLSCKNRIFAGGTIGPGTAVAGQNGPRRQKPYPNVRTEIGRVARNAARHDEKGQDTGVGRRISHPYGPVTRASPPVS